MYNGDDHEANVCFLRIKSRARTRLSRYRARLGQALVQQPAALVYGGASFGIMGETGPDGTRGGRQVIGVMPEELMGKEIAFTGLSDLRVVETMAERKALMAELSDGFIALPGGYGTLEELFEILSISQLSKHEKPCGLLNVAHYYDDLLRFLDHAVDQLFVQPEHRAMILVDEDSGGPARPVRSLPAAAPGQSRLDSPHQHRP